MTLKRIITVVAVVIFTSITTMAAAQQRVQATPHPIKHTQPNGIEFEYRLHGDANLKYTTTLDGYLIKRKENGYFYYLTYNESKNHYKTKCKVSLKEAPSFAIKPTPHFINTIINKSIDRPM